MQIKAEGEGKNAGYDARNNKVVDMIDAGIIDPTKVTRTALELACSVAGTLLTTECVVSIEKEKEEENPSKELLTAISVKPSYSIPSTSKVILDIC